MNQEMIRYIQRLIKGQSEAIINLSLKIDLQEKQLTFFKSCCIRFFTANTEEKKEKIQKDLAEFFQITDSAMNIKNQEDTNNEQVRRPSEAEKPKTTTCYNPDCRYYHENFQAINRSCNCDRIYCTFRIPY